MAYLTPFRVVSGRSIRVRERDGELWRFVLVTPVLVAPDAWEGVNEFDFWLLLGFGGFKGVAVGCCGVGPGDGDCEEWVEGVEDCWYYFCFL